MLAQPAEPTVQPETIKFEDCGLVIGLIRYPFTVNGKELYDKVFKESLFLKHKENMSKYSSDMAVEMYEPMGYRMFGENGLAVLSLFDDYSFCNRTFNNRHIDDDFFELKYSNKIISGTSTLQQNLNGDDSLINKSRNTFLRTKDRFPFVGIIKLKIDYRLLSGCGYELLHSVKQKINEFSKGLLRVNEKLEIIAIDCFDNDDMAVVAFSNDIKTIHDFFSKIRTLDKNAFGNTLSPPHKKQNHLFTSCHSSIGYHIDYDFRKGVDQNFIPTIDDSYKVCLNVIWEAKPGHRLKLIQFLNSKGFDITNEALTGANTIKFKCDLSKIHELEDICKEDNTEIKWHARRIKISLWQDPDNREYFNESKPSYSSDGPAFNKPFLSNLKELLFKTRVSKMSRDRLLGIYAIYNEHVNDLLHEAFFHELKGALYGIPGLIEDLINQNISISDIDKQIGDIIENFEEAFYNRFSQKDFRDTNLEHNGGIQQYLTSFDYVYKTVLRILYRKKVDNHEGAFAFMRGYERVSSVRTNL